MLLLRRKDRDRHRDQIRWFTTLKGIVGMLRDPEHTDSVFDIEDGLRGLRAYRHALEFVRSSPAVRQQIEVRYLAPPPDLGQLLALPAPSLGHAFARHIVDHGFDPDYFRKLDVRDDLDWMLMRIRQTHDIWHVVTGLDTSRGGELALKAFELAQTRRPMALVIAAGGALRYLLRDPAELGAVLRGISLGYRLGLACAPFLAQRWEEGWHRPLADWRAELRVDAAGADPDRVLVGA
ncbi:MAG TPA: Coq4 family protein [Planctomycetota bacterium]